MSMLGRKPRRPAAALGSLALAAGMLAAAARLPDPGQALWRAGATALNDPGAAWALYRPAAVPAAAPAKPQPAAAATPAPAQSAGPSPAPAGGAARTAAATPTPTATPSPTPVPSIPPNAGPITALRYSAGSGSVPLAAGSIYNRTQNADSTLAGIVAEGGLPFTVELGSDEPQVLILHTHATECYQPWPELLYDPEFAARTLDRSQNMCAVGARMAEVLNGAGINTLHDTTLHDSPSYTEAYGRSAGTARDYLEKYPSIKVILDVHRDAIEKDGTRIKPLASVDGADTAQVMIIAGCDNGTTVPLPHWRENLRFAAAWEQQMETLYPGLTRPVLCGYRFYNQDVTTGSLLIEVGGHANTLEEALRAGELAAQALARTLGG